MRIFVTIIFLFGAVHVGVAHADFNVTQSNGTGWVCNGPVVTQHATNIEAIESCADQSLGADGAVYDVTFESEYQVSNTTPMPPVLDPDPDPEPEPEPTPDPDPEPTPAGNFVYILAVPFEYDREPGSITTSGTLPSSLAAGEVLALSDTSVDDSNFTCNASPANPAYILNGTITGAGGVLTISGSGCYFIGTDFNNVQPRTSGSHHVFRNVRVHDHAGKNGISLSGSNIVLADSEVDHNQGNDRHGIYVGPGSDGVWILRNHVHHNGGDGFQACHGCSADPPRNVYIGGNTFNSDRENAVDFKYIVGVIVEGNVIHSLVRAPKDEEWCFDDGSGCGVFSSGSDGSGIVVGSDGAPTDVLIANNTIYNVVNATRIEEGVGVRIVGNKFQAIQNQCLQLDKQGDAFVFSNNSCETTGRGIFQNWRDNFSSAIISGNRFDTGGASIEFETRSLCDSWTLTDNIFIAPASVVCGGNMQTSEDGINGLPGASGNTVQ